MRIVVYGLSVTSSWGNGHATTYRALLRALKRRGHGITFVEKDVPWYRNNRDMPEPDFCEVVLYEDWALEEAALVELARGSDAVVVGSYFPDAIAATKALLGAMTAPVMFYDIDTPVTMAGLRSAGGMAYLDARLIPEYAAYLSFTGGPALRELEEVYGAKRAVGFFCSVDPELYRKSAVRAEFACDLSYLGTYAVDRQAKLMGLLNGAAELMHGGSFLVAGPQYPASERWAANVRRLEHVAPADHPAFYSSSRFTLNLTRADMVATGYSPSVRLFEASACGACILSDEWAGLEEFLTPGEEILLPKNAAEVTAILTGMSDEERCRIGARARERILAEHTAEHRAKEFEGIVAEAEASAP
jgi:spore maturation protein CgeB